MLRQLANGETSAETLIEQHLTRLEATQGTYNGATEIFADEALKQARTTQTGPIWNSSSVLFQIED